MPAEHGQPGPAGRPPRTTRARAAVDAALWASGADGARLALAAACQQRKALPDDVFAVLAMRRGLARLRLIRATMLDIAGGAEALSEIDFVDLCRRFLLPAPDLQKRRKDASGRIRYLDAHWQRWGVHAEVDGAHHMEAGQWTADMIRQSDVWIRGERILRFPASLIRERVKTCPE